MASRSHFSSLNDTFTTEVFDSETDDLINYVSNKIIGIENNFINQFAKKFKFFNFENNENNINFQVSQYARSQSEQFNNNNIKNNNDSYFESDKYFNYENTQNIILEKVIKNNKQENLLIYKFNNEIHNNENAPSTKNKQKKVFKNEANKKLNSSTNITDKLKRLINNVSILDINDEKINNSINARAASIIDKTEHLNFFSFENQQQSAIDNANYNHFNTNNDFNYEENNFASCLNAKHSTNDGNNQQKNHELTSELFQFLGDFLKQIDGIGKLLNKVVNSNYKKNQKIKEFQSKYHALHIKYKEAMLNSEMLNKELHLSHDKCSKFEETTKMLEEENQKHLLKIEELKFNLNLTQYELDKLSTNKDIFKRQESFKKLSSEFNRSLSRDVLLNSAAFQQNFKNKILRPELNKENYKSSNFKNNINFLESHQEEVSLDKSGDIIDLSDDSSKDGFYFIDKKTNNKKNIQNQNINNSTNNHLNSENTNNDDSNTSQKANNFTRKNSLAEVLQMDIEQIKEEKENLLKKIDSLKQSLINKDELLQQALSENNSHLNEIKTLKANSIAVKRENDFLIYEISNIKKDNQYSKRIINLLRDSIPAKNKAHMQSYSLNNDQEVYAKSTSSEVEKHLVKAQEENDINNKNNKNINNNCINNYLSIEHLNNSDDEENKSEKNSFLRAPNFQ